MKNAYNALDTPEQLVTGTPTGSDNVTSRGTNWKGIDSIEPCSRLTVKSTSLEPVHTRDLSVPSHLPRCFNTCH